MNTDFLVNIRFKTIHSNRNKSKLLFILLPAAESLVCRVAVLFFFVRVPSLIVEVLLVLFSLVRNVSFFLPLSLLISASAVLLTLLWHLYLLQKLVQIVSSLFGSILFLTVLLVAMFLCSDRLFSVFLIHFFSFFCIVFSLVWSYLSILWLVFLLLFLFLLKFNVLLLIHFLIVLVWYQTFHFYLFLTVGVTWCWVHKKGSFIIIYQIIVFVIIFDLKTLLLFHVKLFIVIVLSVLFGD